MARHLHHRLSRIIARGCIPVWSVSVGELTGGRTIDIEVSTCELICCKDTGRLLEETVLQRLTSGLEIISTLMLKHMMRHIPGGLGEKMEDWIE
jgi:hypothetical protein